MAAAPLQVHASSQQQLGQVWRMILQQDVLDEVELHLHGHGHIHTIIRTAEGDWSGEHPAAVQTTPAD